MGNSLNFTTPPFYAKIIIVVRMIEASIQNKKPFWFQITTNGDVLPTTNPIVTVKTNTINYQIGQLKKKSRPK